MSRKHTATVNAEIECGGEYLSLTASVRFTYYPAQRATYDYPGHSASVDDVEVYATSIDYGGGKVVPVALPESITDWIAESASEDDLIEAAEGHIAYEADAAADAKYQEMRDERV